MKKTIFIRIATICCICAAAIATAACGGSQPAPAPAQGSSAVAPAQGSSAVASTDASGDSSKYADYIGYQFAGTDPWGGEIAITIRTIKDDTMELTYTDMPSKDMTVYAECSGIPVYSDGTTPLGVTGSVDDKENVIFNYIGSLEFKDGTLVLTYESGSITTESEQGDSDSYQVEALADDDKTVILTKTVDPS
ncbi:MAG: hypothetical protein IKF90_26045 [Parasporobacterium sp.]|nr:hypothetical protein [Parasporobacterium sp.]